MVVERESLERVGEWGGVYRSSTQNTKQTVGKGLMMFFVVKLSVSKQRLTSCLFLVPNVRFRKVVTLLRDFINVWRD